MCAADQDCEPGLGCDLQDRDADQRLDECIPTGADGTQCTQGADCDSHYCNSGRCCADQGDPASTCCAEDRDCTAFDGLATCSATAAGACMGQKVVGRCQNAVCVALKVPSAEGCVGHVCRGAECKANGIFDGPHLCDETGACVPTAELPCDDGRACTFDTCDAVVGCQTIARNGATEARCYRFDPATRLVGACKDGFVTCQAGMPSDCLGERGPAAELCNGVDDDCDGRTDEDTESACFPYLCGGVAGCRARCETAADCAAGNFCNGGACVGTGENGAACGGDEACQSGHCLGGVCCDAGLCCRSEMDCASLGDASCDSAGAEGCMGTRTVGRCGEGAMCRAEVVADASACTGELCLEASCDGVMRVPEQYCQAEVCVPPLAESCTPYACTGGQCGTSCSVDAECTGGASCIGGTCLALPDGAACRLASQCASGLCDNGFCCQGPGPCCGDASTCTGLAGAAVCRDSSTCEGVRIAGVCGADHQCRAVEVASPDACLGQSCGGSSCVNLEGGELVLEGARRDVCSAEGACMASVRDCRDNPAASYCTRASSLFIACQHCTPDRPTCVVFGNPCYCE